MRNADHAGLSAAAMASDQHRRERRFPDYHPVDTARDGPNLAAATASVRRWLNVHSLLAANQPRSAAANAATWPACDHSARVNAQSEAANQGGLCSTPELPSYSAKPSTMNALELVVLLRMAL